MKNNPKSKRPRHRGMWRFIIGPVAVTILVILICWTNGLTLSDTMLIIVPLILVFVTWFYALEARKTRLEAVRPELSLRLGSGFTTGSYADLLLQNSGGIARNIEIDVETINPSSKKAFFLSALGKGSVCNLEIESFMDVQDRKGSIQVGFKYIDAYNRNHREELSIDFSKLQQEGRGLVHQWFISENELYRLSKRLRTIDRSIRMLKGGTYTEESTLFGRGDDEGFLGGSGGILDSE